jgi:hypothetical protein
MVKHIDEITVLSSSMGVQEIISLALPFSQIRGCAG